MSVFESRGFAAVSFITAKFRRSTQHSPYFLITPPVLTVVGFILPCLGSVTPHPFPCSLRFSFPAWFPSRSFLSVMSAMHSMHVLLWVTLKLPMSPYDLQSINRGLHHLHGLHRGSAPPVPAEHPVPLPSALSCSAEQAGASLCRPAGSLSASFCSLTSHVP